MIHDCTCVPTPDEVRVLIEDSQPKLERWLSCDRFQRLLEFQHQWYRNVVAMLQQDKRAKML